MSLKLLGGGEFRKHIKAAFDALKLSAVILFEHDYIQAPSTALIASNEFEKKF